MQPLNMVLVDHGPIVICKDGKQVDFNSFDEFELYAGPALALPLENKGYLCYIPDQQVLTDTVTSETFSEIVPEYEAIISFFDTLKARKDDRFYGLSGEELATAQREYNALSIRAQGSAQLLALGTPYLAEERETWITQEAEARAWTANNNASCPMVSAMATTRGISMALMVQKIIENADLFKVESGKILGAQQKALDELG